MEIYCKQDGYAHIVPLLLRLFDILKSCHVGTGNGELLFPNMRNYQNHISEVTMIGALRRMATRRRKCPFMVSGYSPNASGGSAEGAI